MCGIAGYVQRPGSDQSIIKKMISRIAHRGPDGEGTWAGNRGEWSVVLGHRRLAIIDLEGGAQPMGNEDGSLQITYNGELYNHAALHDNLAEKGHVFRTRSDTEAIVHHIEEYGIEGLHALDGMFAFALWDQRAGRLLLARDRVGIKPLYYATLPDGGLAFASELTALLAHSGVLREVDPAGLASFLFLDYSHAPGCVLKNIRKLEPGCCVIWSGGTLQDPRRYWSLEERPGSVTERGEALIDRMRMGLNKAVRSQLLADVPVGVFLSGGIDSSLVAALAKRHVSGRLKTFTIRFDDPQFDESAFARAVAGHIGSEHIEEALTESALLDHVGAALDCLDEPLADPSVIPTFVLSRLASRHVKVALGGDGGDELWAGYPTYKAHRMAGWYGKIPGGIRRGVVEGAVRRLPVKHGYQTFEWKAKRFALRWDDSAPARHLRWMSSLDVGDLTLAMPGQHGLPWLFYAAMERAAKRGGGGGGGDGLNSVLGLDFETYLPGSVLTKVDRASMAHGLEVRPPLLANAMVDLAFALPFEVKMRGSVTKALLKDAAGAYLPREIIHRRKKGFAIPLAAWLRGPLAERLREVTSNGPVWATGLVSRDIFQRWAKEHESMRVDRSRPLWALIVLDHWMRRALA